MKKMLFIVGLFLFSLGVSNVYAQSSSFVPLVVNVHVASGVGNVIKPRLSFYKVSNPSVATDINTFRDWTDMPQGSTSGVFYIPVQEAGTYNIAFTGESPLHTVLMSSIKLDVEKGYYNLDIYVEPITSNSRMTISGPY